MGCPVTTSSLSPLPSLVEAAPVAVVVSTSGTISGVVALDCVCVEGAFAADSVMVGVTLVATAPVAVSGLGAGSPPPWAASATGSWGPPPLVAPLPLEPWDASITFGFVTLDHSSKDQKTWVKSGKKKGKICNKCVAYHRAP
jgi:hypothetical protein